MSSGTECCNVCFKFEGVNLEEVSYYKFHAAGGKKIMLVYLKDGHVYISISFDCGKTWLEPKTALEVAGKIEDIQFLTKDSQYVISLLESVSGRIDKRVIAGNIDFNNYTINYRECEKHEPKGKLLGVSLGFREKDDKNEESVDYEFTEENGEICVECFGHG